MAWADPTWLATRPPTAAPSAWLPMSTPTAMPIAEARVSRLSRMPITVLVGIDTANMPPAIAKATNASAPLASSQNSGAAAAAVTAPHQAALRRRRWWSRVPLAIAAVPISVPTGHGGREQAERTLGHARPRRAYGHDERLAHGAERAGDGDDHEGAAHQAVAEERRGTVAERADRPWTGTPAGSAAAVWRSPSRSSADTRKLSALMASATSGSTTREQQAAERVADDQRRLHRDAGQRERVAVAVLGDEVGQGRGAGRLEGRGGETGEEREHEQPADRDREEHGGEERGPGDVGRRA